MTLNAAQATVVAQAEAGQEGGSSMFMLLMLAVLAVLFIMMIRRSRKAMKTQQAQRASLEPGMQVMTTFGLYGTVTEIDHDENKAVMELSPGQYATVHLQAVGQVVEEEASEDELPASDITIDDIPDYPESPSSDTQSRDLGSEYNDPRDERDR